MSRKIFGFAAGFFTLAWLPAQAQDFSRSLELRLSGGFLRLAAGDFSRYHTDTRLYYDEQLGPLGFDRAGSLTSLENGREITPEALLRISRRIGIGMSVGYFETAHSESVIWSHSEQGDLT